MRYLQRGYADVEPLTVGSHSSHAEGAQATPEHLRGQRRRTHLVAPLGVQGGHLMRRHPPALMEPQLVVEERSNMSLDSILGASVDRQGPELAAWLPPVVRGCDSMRLAGCDIGRRLAAMWAKDRLSHAANRTPLGTHGHQRPGTRVGTQNPGNNHSGAGGDRRFTNSLRGFDAPSAASGAEGDQRVSKFSSLVTRSTRQVTRTDTSQGDHGDHISRNFAHTRLESQTSLIHTTMAKYGHRGHPALGGA